MWGRTLWTAVVLGGLVGCSEDTGAANDGGMASDAAAPAGEDAAPAPGAVDVTLGIVNHSLNRLAAGTEARPELTGVEVGVLAVDAVLADVDAAPLAVEPLATPCGAPCVHALGAVPSPGGGLLSLVRGEGWMPTWTGIGTAVGGRIDDGRGFALSAAAVDDVLAPLLGLSGDELRARGVVFGLVYSGASADGSGQPLIGATVTASDPDFTVVYPDGRFARLIDATAMQGVFVAVPSAAAGIGTVSFEVTPPAGTDLRWDATAAAIRAPGRVYFHLMYPVE